MDATEIAAAARAGLLRPTPVMARKFVNLRAITGCSRMRRLRLQRRRALKQ